VLQGDDDEEEAEGMEVDEAQAAGVSAHDSAVVPPCLPALSTFMLAVYSTTPPVVHPSAQ
jgi:hypothetical protein